MYFETERDAEIFIEDQLLGEVNVTHEVIWVNENESSLRPWDDGGYIVTEL